MKRLTAIAPVVLFLALAFVVRGSFFGGQTEALSGSDFQAGNIITDSNFFNEDALSAVQIQQFLDAKVPTCDTNGSEPYRGTTRAAYGTARGNPPPYTCLKSYRQKVPARSPEDQLCKGIASSGSTKKTAAQIIDIVSRSCGVSQKVLIILLEKEQSLVTDDWPWDIQYRSATGYGCPDTAPCDSEYYGFFNQVYNAARIYKYYAKYPDNFNHIAGVSNYVRYHPNSSCGGRNVVIRNQATAGLYNYTPYQPNGSALNNLYGTGNSCSAYGNRNFWRIYNDWFGSTTTEPYPTTPFVGDWDGDGEDTIGIKQGKYYHLDNDNDGVADITIGVGRVSDQVFVGDWDGNGEDSIALKRGNYYYLRDETGSAWKTLGLGKTTDQVFVGDWDGNGEDSIALKRGNYYYLRDETGSAWKTIGMGRANDKVIVGDWDDDGHDEIGLDRLNHFYLDNNMDGDADIHIGFGKTTDQLIIGDWDGDGDDNLGLKRGNYYYFDNDNDGKPEIHFGLGKSSDKVLIGNWDGNARDDLILQRYNRYYIDTNLNADPDISFTLNYF